MTRLVGTIMTIKDRVDEICRHDDEDINWWEKSPDVEGTYNNYATERLNAAFTRLGRCMTERDFLLRIMGHK